MMKSNKFFFVLTAAFCLVAGTVQAKSNLNELVNAYIEEWAGFYPSEALSNGLKEAAWEFEDFSGNRVGEWIGYNRRTVEMLESLSDLSVDEQVDARVLRRQANRELERWVHEEALVNQPAWYAEVISQALTYILVRDQFTPEEKVDAVLQRLPGVQSMCKLGIVSLQDGSPERTRRAVEVLERTRTFYHDNLPGLMHDWSGGKRQEQVTQVINDTVNSVDALLHHIREDVLPDASIPDRLDDQDYARKLRIYTDSDLTPAQLRDHAAAEIEEVRRLMAIEAKAWWNEQESGSPMPADENGLLEVVMEEMEQARSDNRSDFLDFFRDLTDRAETFLLENDLATVPLPRTIYVGLSPDHFSGAAYGGVYSTGPFNPGADTLFYLPSIPDDSSPEQKEGFYRSFNDHFNTMIIAHEIYPGHYLQLKVAADSAPALRSLFGNGVYIEGWGTFSEELMLNAGWDEHNRLTRLAHLRKRLENATRAYVSVMVHVEDWNKDQVMDFAVTRGLLPPQFALNL
ncbi:MAG: DUF885 domain-containing protein, partial [Gammaproteobacteria bacterium]|nr:DUF885 domain-containing protein [Gammaproteobacteria bacterium]